MALQRLATLALLCTAEPSQAIEWPWFIHWIGRENPIVNGKIYGFRLRFSLKPIHCSMVGNFFFDLSFSGVKELYFSLPSGVLQL
jgi:hypothetical protein